MCSFFLTLYFSKAIQTAIHKEYVNFRGRMVWLLSNNTMQFIVFYIVHYVPPATEKKAFKILVQ